MASSILIPLRAAACIVVNVWAGATHDSLWPRNRVQKWGPPAHSGVLPAPKLNVAPRASSVLLNTSVHRRGERNARQKVICVFHATFTFPRQKSRLNLTRIFAPLPLQRPQKQKMSKTNYGRHRTALGFPSFDPRFGNDPTSLREISTQTAPYILRGLQKRKPQRESL